MEKTYVAIDLKSFYASVECVERQLDPLNTNLVVADESRTEKTICLAVSPSLKSFGISGRARLFEVIQRVEQVNKERLQKAPKRQFAKKSYIYSELSDPACELDYIDGNSANGEIFGCECKNIRYLSEICVTGGYFRLFYRRGLY